MTSFKSIILLISILAGPVTCVAQWVTVSVSDIASISFPTAPKEIPLSYNTATFRSFVVKDSTGAYTVTVSEQRLDNLSRVDVERMYDNAVKGIMGHPASTEAAKRDIYFHGLVGKQVESKMRVKNTLISAKSRILFVNGLIYNICYAVTDTGEGCVQCSSQFFNSFTLKSDKPLEQFITTEAKRASIAYAIGYALPFMLVIAFIFYMLARRRKKLNTP